jgi:RNAse (barnase) inhibitor barstar
MSGNVHLQAILSSTDKAGVYHLPHTDKKQIVAAAKAAGLSAFRVDLAKVGTREQLLAAIADALKFPAWYGHNLDALADCLGDMSWQPAEGYLVLLEHCDSIHRAAEADFLSTIEVFTQTAADWQDQGVAFWCLIEMQADGIAWLPSGP